LLIETSLHYDARSEKHQIMPIKALLFLIKITEILKR